MTLDKCFELVAEEDGMPPNSRCVHCSALGKVHTRCQVWSLPPVLVVHLKRVVGIPKRKIDTLVEFPIVNVDLVAHSLRHQTEGAKNESCKYDLQAVSNHTGSALLGGHYTTVAKHADTGVWHHFNDTVTSVVADPSTIVTPGAYILVFVKRVE